MSVIYSAVPTFDDTGRCFPNTHVGGTNAVKLAGIGVEASLGADCISYLKFPMPAALPSGTAKMRIVAQANATTGVAKINVKWVSVAMEENPDTATYNAEGVGTITWASGDADVFKELVITMDADTIVVDEMIMVKLTFETSSWTLAQVMTCDPYMFFE